MTGRPQLKSSTCTQIPTGHGVVLHASPPQGTIAIGGHLIRAYLKTQAVFANDSGESELYAAVRASAEALGILTLLADFGCSTMRASVGMDASAAIGIVQRQGMSKLRHVEVDVLRGRAKNPSTYPSDDHHGIAMPIMLLLHVQTHASLHMPHISPLRISLRMA